VDAGVKQRTGAHSVSTITRRISSVSMAHKQIDVVSTQTKNG
jgi:hypothetical protein